MAAPMPSELPASVANALAHQGNESFNFFPIEVKEDTANIIVGDETSRYSVAVMCSHEEGWGICMSPDEARKLAQQLSYAADLAESGALGGGGDA
jgi:hypothetical protein